MNAIILLAPAALLRRMPNSYGNIFFRYSLLDSFTYLRKPFGDLLQVNLARIRQRLMHHRGLIQPKSKV